MRTISDSDPVTARTSFAHSRIVHSSGLPMLTGRCSSERDETNDAVDQVGDVAEAAGLRTIAIDGKGLSLEGLDHEVRDDAPVVGLKARAVGVEDADQWVLTP